VPIGWFFLPPPGHGVDWVEPVDDTKRHLAMVAGDLIAHIVGTPMGWDSFVEGTAHHLTGLVAAQA